MPFKGRLEGTATITPGTPPFLSVSIEGTGNATHLGRFISEIPHAVNTTNRTSIGTYEFTAANGDTLTASFAGQATLMARAFSPPQKLRRSQGVQGGSPTPTGALRSSACSTS